MRLILLFYLLFNSIISTAQTFVPDANFEQALIDLGYDDTLDSYLTNSVIITIDSLDISGNNFDMIYDLTGIEGFLNLQYLNCSNHKLDTLNLNSNIYIKHLICANDSLSHLVIDNLNSLNKLECNFNNLTSLDISTNLALNYLDCSRNYLSTLDLIDNNYLSYLYCGNNNIQYLDLSNMLMGGVYFIACENNSIISINLEGNSNLSSLYCYNNNLNNIDLTDCINLNNISLGNIFSQPSNFNNNFSELDLSNNCNISNFNSLNLPNLNCIQVCDSTLVNSWNHLIDSQQYFNINCNFTNNIDHYKNEKKIIFKSDIFGRKLNTNSSAIILHYFQDGSVKKIFKLD